jgi:hypothetical protein
VVSASTSLSSRTAGEYQREETLGLVNRRSHRRHRTTWSCLAWSAATRAGRRRCRCRR